MFDLSPKSRWALQKIVLSKFAGLSKSVDSNQSTLAALHNEGVDLDRIEKLVRVEQERLAGNVSSQSGLLWPSPISRNILELVYEDLEAGLRNALRLVDLFEVLLKYIASVAISDVVRGPGFSEDLQSFLAESLQIPSLGHWAGYLRICANELSNREQEPFIAEIVDYQEKYIKGEIDILLALRNSYAHGATPPEEQCIRDCIENMPRLFRLLQGAAFLTRYPLICAGESDTFLAMGNNLQSCQVDRPPSEGSVFIHNPSRNSWLEISPLLAFRKCRYKRQNGAVCGHRKFLFYNDQKKKRYVTYLDYQWGHYGRDPEALMLFRKVFPIPAWRTAREKDRITAIIEEKTRNFIGREQEIEEISSWITSSRRGYFMILGPLGIGKSSLAAALTQIKWESTKVFCQFIRRFERPTPLEFLRRLLNDLALTFNTEFVAGSQEEMQLELERQLRLAGDHLQKTGEKLLIIIDGLDEALLDTVPAGQGSTVLGVLPRRVPDNILVLMTGRPRAEVNNLYDELDREARRKLQLQGLSQEDIRGLLYGPISKYELKPKYVADVYEKSGGNPLYINLIIEEIFEGRMKANDARILPRSLEEIFDSILKRLLQGNENVLRILLTLAHAREQLTVSQIAQINQLSTTRTLQILEHCMEVLREDRDLSDNRTLSLFHESFAEFLKNHKDLAGEQKQILLQYLEYCIRENGHYVMPDHIPSALIHKKEITKEDLNALSKLIENSSSLLTSFTICIEALSAHPLINSTSDIAQLAAISGTATSRALTYCLKARLQNEQDYAENILKALLPSQKDLVHTGSVQKARICAELVLTALLEPGSRQTALDVLYKLVTHRDDRILTIGILTVFRASKFDPDAALSVVQQLTQEAIFWGIPKMSFVKPLIGCLTGLLFEHAENREFRTGIGEIISSFLSRTVFLKPLAWFLPSVANGFLSRIPDDYNSINLTELRSFKKELEQDPELATFTCRLAEHCDPTHGSLESFQKLMQASIPLLNKHNSAFLMCFVQMSILNRTLTGNDTALEESYNHWQKTKSLDGACCHDLAYQLRITQVARRLRNQPPLEERWTERVEEIIRHFFYEKDCRFVNQNEYVGGSLIAALPFLVEQRGGKEPEILKEFIEYAFSKLEQNSSRERKKKYPLVQILLRVLEVNAVEYGTYDQAGRTVAFYGLRCFLSKADLLDENTWQAITRMLAKAQVFYPQEVENFIAILPERIEQELLRRLQKTVPDNKMGELLSMRSEKFLAVLYSEPVSSTSPLRPYMMEVLHILARPESLKVTLHRLVQVVFRALYARNEH